MFRKSLIGLALASVFCSPAYAQAPDENDDDVEKIIVTATKRSLAIEDVPFSINAQTQKDIERSGATTLEDISRNIASVSIQNLGPGQSQVSMRGVSAGQIVRDQPGVKEQVGIYLDESVISLSLFTPDLDFFDFGGSLSRWSGATNSVSHLGHWTGSPRFLFGIPSLPLQFGQRAYFMFVLLRDPIPNQC
jgi:hypothetical protein